MIKHIQIKDYKCLHDENLEIKPFTIVRVLTRQVSQV